MRDQRPSIVLIVIDTARRERFGAYGYHRPTTPVMDGIAATGAVFEQMIATAPWTLPSHASLFTGLYAREHGAERPAYRMREGILTLAEHLDTCGYSTAVFSNNRLVSTRTGLVDGVSETFRRHTFDPAMKRAALHRMRILLGQIDRGARLTNRAVEDFLRRRSRPFFIFINYMECHGHYRPLRSFERRFVRRRFTLVDSARHRIRMRQRRVWDGLGWNAEEQELLNDLYDASLAYVDERIGELLEIVDRSGGDEPIVLITADHGENLGDHERFGHDLSLDQTLIRVPCIARTPGGTRRRISGLVQLTDVFAGLCGLAGAPVPLHLTDRPFAVDPFRLQPGDRGRAYAFSESHQWEGGHLQERLRRAPAFKPMPSADAVQDGRFKLIVERTGSGEQLFDLHTDPGETQDVAGTHPGERSRLRAALEEWERLCQPVGNTTAYTAEEERMLTARLEELGYL